MEDIRAFLAENAEKMGICLTDEQTEKFQTYAELLVEWNEKMNLTAIKEPREIAVKHFVDSLTIFSCIQPKKEAKVIDIGSGAGFPGLLVVRLEFCGRDVFLIQRHVKFALHLGAGAFGIAQEPNEFYIGFGIETLGDVVHGRTGGIAYLSL